MRDRLQTQPSPYEVLGVDWRADDKAIDAALARALVKRNMTAAQARTQLRRPFDRGMVDLLLYNPEWLKGLRPNPLDEASALEPERRAATAAAWEARVKKEIDNVGLVLADILLKLGVSAFKKAQDEAAGTGLTKKDIVAAYRRGLADLTRAQELGSVKAKEAEDRSDLDAAVMFCQAALEAAGRTAINHTQKILAHYLNNRAVRTLNKAIEIHNERARQQNEACAKFKEDLLGKAAASLGLYPFGRPYGTQECQKCGTTYSDPWMTLTLEGGLCFTLCSGCVTEYQAIADMASGPTSDIVARLQEVHKDLDEASDLDPKDETIQKNLKGVKELLGHYNASPERREPPGRAQRTRSEAPARSPGGARRRPPRLLDFALRVGGGVFMLFLGGYIIILLALALSGSPRKPSKPNRSPSSSLAPAASSEGDRVVLKTSKGQIVIDLYEEDAPKHGESFKRLVRQGAYDGLPLNREIGAGVVYGGDLPAQKDVEGLRPTIPPEIQHKHVRGALAAPRAQVGVISDSERESHPTRFYICLQDQPHLDGTATVFGEVVSGIEALAHVNLAASLVRAPGAGQADRIVSAKVVPGRRGE